MKHQSCASKLQLRLGTKAAYSTRITSYPTHVRLRSDSGVKRGSLVRQIPNVMFRDNLGCAVKVVYHDRRGASNAPWQQLRCIVMWQMSGADLSNASAVLHNPRVCGIPLLTARGLTARSQTPGYAVIRKRAT